MKRVVAALLAFVLSLFTYAMVGLQVRLASGELGHSKYDGSIMFMYWMLLVIAWCLVLWMFEKKRT